MWFVYVLSTQKKDFVVGACQDLDKEMEKHAAGKIKATKDAAQLKCETYVAIPTKKQAKALEAYFKTAPGGAVLKKQFLGK
jgi:predicted GIY-YIG superfamily endonuclease